MDLYTNCFIPSIGKEIKVNSIKFGDLFELNSYIHNSDYENASMIFERMCSRSFGVDNNFTNLDKFVLLLHLKHEFLEKILTLSAKDKNSKKISYEILIKDILDLSQKYDTKDFALPKKLYYKDVGEILKETGKNIDEIKKHINDNKVLMFDVPDFIKGIPKVYINCFDNTFFYFSKLLYGTNLKNLYEKIKKLKKNFNFLLSEIYDMNPKEIDIFLDTK